MWKVTENTALVCQVPVHNTTDLAMLENKLAS